MSANINSTDYYMPAEWATHEATWLSWPHNKETWPGDGKYQKMIAAYCKLIQTISVFENVNINVGDQALEDEAKAALASQGIHDTKNIFFHHFPTNDAWCRDHGPIFVKRKATAPASLPDKVIVNWEYNAWGGKYPPFQDDNLIPSRIARLKDLPILSPGIVMEGGSIEVNGKGTLLTTRACLLNKNRNPHLTQAQIEDYLQQYLGISQILWLEDGIVGDDTDGHIDDLCRFIDEDTIVTITESDPTDANYHILKENLEALESFRNPDGKPFHIVELPMPAPLVVDGQRLPASYANFLIVNGAVLVPVFDDPNDQVALDILQAHVKERKVIGIDCKDIVWGLGTIHCMTQQEPK